MRNKTEPTGYLNELYEQTNIDKEWQPINQSNESKCVADKAGRYFRCSFTSKLYYKFAKQRWSKIPLNVKRFATLTMSWLVLKKLYQFNISRGCVVFEVYSDVSSLNCNFTAEWNNFENRTIFAEVVTTVAYFSYYFVDLYTMSQKTRSSAVAGRPCDAKACQG